MPVVPSMTTPTVIVSLHHWRSHRSRLSDTKVGRNSRTGNEMGGGFRVLFVEDEDADVTLARHALQQDGLEFTWRCVATESDLRHALGDFSPDIVLCEYALPGY